ncbi:MAG: VWA domain-containing protein [Clostridium sp.]|uniref:VWA domain-containing protein n=1 Tax=Clostridium sp. TaxID=1506 RepID=UPI003D6C8BC2
MNKDKSKRSEKKVICFVILIIFILTQVFAFRSSADAGTIVKAPITLTKTTNITNAKVNDEITLNYNIKPGIVTVVPSTQSKEIALVIDASGSMDTGLQGNDSRLKVAKAAANRFIDKFNTDSKVKIGLVQYESSAKKKSGLVDKNSFPTLKTSINEFTAHGGTNTGDGLRLAYYMLKESPDINAKKYIVLLTDGEPTFYSYTNNKTNIITSNIESGYDTNNSNDETRGLDYADSIATLISGSTSNINSFMIGCTLSDYGTNTLKEIAAKAKGTCSFAQTATDIDTVYTQLANQIQNELPVNSIKFQETLPPGIEIKEVPAGFTVLGQTITGDLANIPYKIITGTNNYTSDPVNFQIKVKATKMGVFPLSKDASGISNSFITYKDFDNTDAKQLFTPVNVTIANPTASINLGRTVDKTNIKVNDKFNLAYNIQPQDIPVEDIDSSYEKGSDIVLVIDNSGSMDEILPNSRNKTKIQVVRDTANTFINKFNGNSNINIALVKFSTKADVIKLDGASLVFGNLGNNTQRNYLINKIADPSVLNTDGGTNIGDGLIAAYGLLKNQENTGRKKYVILLTDGVPTVSTVNNYNFDYKKGNNKNYEGYVYGEDVKFDKYFRSITNYEYKMDQNTSSVRYVVNPGDSDYNQMALNYAYNLSDTIKNDTTLNVKPIMIAFSKGADVSKLSQIAGRAGGEYKTALSQADMDSVYTSIAGQIESDFTISDVKFEETFPTGINLDQESMPAGFSVSGQKVTGVLNSISYKLDPTGKVYKPISDPSFSIGNLYSTAAGNYKLGQKQSSFITYKDINKEQTKKYFPETNIGISATTPPDIVATLVPKAGQSEVYTLTVTSKTVSNNKINKLEEGSVRGGIQTKLWESTNALALTTDQSLTHDFNKSDITGNTSLYIKATDSNSKTVTETVSLVAVSSVELPDVEQKNNIRPGNVIFSAEPNATINSIKVNTKQIVTNQNTGEGEYESLNVDLIGQNTIDVEITNENGNTTKMSLNEIVDVSPPIIVSNYSYSNKKIEAKFYSDNAKITSEKVNLIWLECDLNLDKKITADEKIIVSTNLVSKLSDIQIPDKFQGKNFLVKAREISGNIGSASPGDNLPPIGTVSYAIDPITTETESYNPAVIINKNVIATVIFDEPDVTITNNNGLATKEFTENGEYIFEFSDKTGNKGTAIATVNNIDKTAIIKHGMFINGAFNEIKSEYEIAEGFSGSFGVDFTTSMKNSKIKLKTDAGYTVSDFKLYKIVGEGQTIFISNISVPSKIVGVYEITMPDIENGITHFIIAYKGTVNGVSLKELTNSVKIGNSLESHCKIKVEDLPDLF